MRAERVLCNAKLNLSLDITGIRADGYHDMDMVMQSVSLSDRLTAEKTGGGIEVRSNRRFLPTDRRNLVFRAAELLIERCRPPKPGVRFLIEKHIPSQAGLGGGSADAAGALLLLRRLWDLPLGDGELTEIGLSLGADVPFCLCGGTARVTGVGEIIRPLPAFQKGWFVIAMPRQGTSTKEAFRMIDREKGYERPDTGGLVRAMREGRLEEAAERMKNVFETSGANPSAGALIGKMLASGALGASMSGTGSAVFGFFRDSAAAERCGVDIRPFARPFVVRPVGRGVRFLR